MPSGFLYWCDFSSTVASQNAIRRIKPDGSGFRSIVTSGIGRNGIRGIAVDWAAGGEPDHFGFDELPCSLMDQVIVMCLLTVSCWIITL